MTTNYNNQKEEENFLFGKDKKSPFVVPKGYFDTLPGKLMSKIEAVQELELYPTLSAIAQHHPSPKESVFVVPQNYFIKNQNLLEYRYELAAYSCLNTFSKPVLNPLTEDYFNTFSAKVLKQIEQTDELKNYATLSSIDKKQAFEVAPDYFDAVADKVKKRYHSKKPQKISVFEQALHFLIKPKMAFAFSVILIVGIGMAIYFNQPSTRIMPGDCKTLACLERNELLNDRTMQNLDEDNLYDLVNVDELDKQLSVSTADSLKNNMDSLPTDLK